MMRSAGNFSPEWGYLAPAPSKLRTIRVVLVATAIGATAGAGVVLSLVDRPTGDADRVAVAAHAIVTSAQAALAMESPKVSAAPVATPAVSPAAATAATKTAAPAQATVAAPQAQEPQVQAPQAQAAPALAQPDHTAQPSNVALPAQQAVSAQGATANDSSAAATPPQAAVAALSEATPAGSAAPDAPAVTSDASATDDGLGFVGPQQPQRKKHHTASGYKDGFPDISGTLRHLFNARHNSTAYYPNRAY